MHRAIVTFALAGTLMGCGGATKTATMTAEMFSPFCDPVGDGRTVQKRKFFNVLLKDPTVTTPIVPGAAPGLVEPTCNDMLTNALPNGPRVNELLYTWMGAPMVIEDGSNLTFGQFAKAQASFDYYVDANGDFVLKALRGVGFIPNGTYTIWFIDAAAAFQMGINPNILVKPFGGPAGGDNTVIAGADGTLKIGERRHPGGGKVQGLKVPALTYHLDGQTYGPEPTPNNTLEPTAPGQLYGITVADALWGEVMTAELR